MKLHIISFKATLHDLAIVCAALTSVLELYQTSDDASQVQRALEIVLNKLLEQGRTLTAASTEADITELKQATGAIETSLNKDKNTKH